MKYEVWFDSVQNGLFKFIKVPAIFIKLWGNDLRQLSLSKDAPIVSWLAKGFNIQPSDILVDQNGEYFGAGNILRMAKRNGNSILITSELPKMTSTSYIRCPKCEGAVLVDKICLDCNGTGYIKELCLDCNGTGKNEWNEDCMFCGGKGYEIENDWSLANALIRNLRFLFGVANAYLDKDVPIEYSPMITNDPYSVDIGMDIMGIENWLENLNEKDSQKVLDIMKMIYCYMWNESGDSFEVNIRAKEGVFLLVCPGDRCSVYGNQTSGIYTHNIDNPAQVLTLFAGVCEMQKLKK